ncbi:MAG: hypothetical protein N2448_06865 [Caloramator sp.]|nr:hypothetical protein [Caloramator sp.]
MSINQVVFSIIKKGFFRGYNFDVLKASETIDKSDINEIKNILKPIIAMLKNKEENKSKNIFSFFRLKSGNFCMLKCCINDLKNSFAQTLIFNEKLDFYPIELINSNIFIESLEDLEEKILLNLDNINPLNIISKDNIKDFLLRGRQLYFKRLLNAVIHCSETKNSIYIKNTDNNFIFLMASLHMCLSKSLSYNITFSTDTLLPIECLIYGVNSSYKSEELFFDFSSQNLPATADYEFSNFALNYYLGSNIDLINFNNFTEDCSYNVLDSKIDNCLYLYEIIRKNKNLKDEEKSVDISHLAPAFEFASENIPDDLILNIYNALESSLQVISRSVELNSLKPFSKFIFKATQKEKIPSFIDKNCYYFYAAIDIIAVKNYDYLNELLDIFNEIVNHFESISYAIFKNAVSKERIALLNVLLSRDEFKNRSGFYIYITIKSMISLGYSYSQAIKTEGLEKLLNQSFSVIYNDFEYISKILKICKDDIEYFINIVKLLYKYTENTIVSNLFIKQFINSIDTFNEKDIFIIRKKLIESDYENLIYEECIERLKNSNDVIQSFLSIEKDILSEFSNFNSKYINDIVKNFVELIPSERLLEQCKIILLKAEEGIYNLDDNILKILFNIFEDNLNFNNINDDLKDYVYKFKKLKSTKNIKTSPDIISMLYFIYSTKDKIENDYEIDDIISMSLDIEKLEINRYFDFINLSLPLVLCFIKSFNDHRKIIRYFDSFDMGEKFLNLYINKIDNLFTINKDKAYNALLHFIIYFFYCLEPKYKLSGEDEAIEFIRGNIKHIINNLPKDLFIKLKSDVPLEFETIGVSIPLQWNEMIKDA